MNTSLSRSEFIITRLIKVSGYSAIIFVGMIFYFLISEGLPTLGEVQLPALFSTRWYPIEDYFGILPLLGGSLIVTDKGINWNFLKSDQQENNFFNLVKGIEDLISTII